MQLEQFSLIQLVILDVDGVMTDGRTRQDEHGQWKRVFSVRDSIGIRALRKLGVQFAVVTQASGQAASDIREHVRFIGVDDYFEDCDSKDKVIEQLMQRLDLRPEQVLFMSESIHDLAIFQCVGCKVTVSGAAELLRKAASYVTVRDGGDGAVLEICNLVIQSRQRSQGLQKTRIPGGGRRAVG